MSQPRIKEVSKDQAVYYLVTNRVAAGRFLFKDLEKQKFKDLLFLGTDRLCYQVVDYVFMNNHFHLVLKIPPLDEISEAQLLERFRIFKNDRQIEFLNEAQKEEFKLKIHDISFIVGNFEQRFVQWFNKEHKSWGNLFGKRFDSELIEVSEHTDSLMRVMAYVTLNPVRAGIVDDPKEYHFCGYAERLASGRVGACDDELFDLFGDELSGQSVAQKRSHFRQIFRAYMLGFKRFKSADSDTLEELFAQCDKSEKLYWDDIFIHKCRFFTKCLIIGSESFIREKLNKFAEKMNWKRPHQPYTEDEWNGIHSLKSKRGRASP